MIIKFFICILYKGGGELTGSAPGGNNNKVQAYGPEIILSAAYIHQITVAIILYFITTWNQHNIRIAS
jgi:hypothetical protein